ncbi:hypothetical protein BJF85_10020 [Saccharomonospora sp. CUA-673]|nr:hypothetical protein BJF85_10020 [Saccharomonospora sp. CUA-673]
MLLLDTAAPLAVFYGLRWAGVNPWLALLLGGAIPLATLVYRLVTERRITLPAVFTLTILIAGTALGLVTGDPRLLLARESYLTAIVGLWILGTLWASRPILLSATLPLLPEQTARAWEHDWEHDPTFRRVMRRMTAAWGGAFLLDAAARVVMAYTLPVDVVPALSAGFLVVLLTAIVQFTKAYGRRLQRARDGDDETEPDVVEGVGRSGSGQ